MTIDCTKSDEDFNIRNLINDLPDLTRTDRYDSDREEEYSRRAYEDMRDITKLAVRREIIVKNRHRRHKRSHRCLTSPKSRKGEHPAPLPPPKLP